VARFRPFRAIRYSTSRVGALDPIVAPPYDVISPAERDAFYESSPFNCTRLILNKEGHDAAADQYRGWIGEGVLSRDDAAAFYLYVQEFEANGPRRRIGVLGALALEPYSTGVVLRHENTFAHHKQDRLELTRRVRANLSPIFCVYSKPGFVPEPDGGWSSAPDVDLMHQGVRHRLWAVRSAEGIARIRGAVADEALFIADGHHRYETALNYWYERHDGAEPPTGADAPDDEAQPEAHVLAFLAAFEDPGMVILPTHRELVSAGGASATVFETELSTSFALQGFPADEDGSKRLLEALSGVDSDRHGFGIALRGLPRLLLATRPVAKGSASALEALDVKVLHDDILGSALARAGAKDPKLAYSIDGAQILRRVLAGELDGAFLMNATRPGQMAAVCRAGELMPHKSTYFYPKLLTGLVFHALG
jgi:uncharacterized protein (DUF1015 family)